MSTTGDDASWVKWVLAGMGTLFAGALAIVRQEARGSSRAIWQAINEDRRDGSDRRVDAERQFATKADLAALEDRFYRQLDKQTSAITAAIDDRPPVRTDR